MYYRQQAQQSIESISNLSWTESSYRFILIIMWVVFSVITRFVFIYIFENYPRALQTSHHAFCVFFSASLIGFHYFFLRLLDFKLDHLRQKTSFFSWSLLIIPRVAKWILCELLSNHVDGSHQLVALIRSLWFWYCYYCERWPNNTVWPNMLIEKWFSTPAKRIRISYEKKRYHKHHYYWLNVWLLHSVYYY